MNAFFKGLALGGLLIFTHSANAQNTLYRPIPPGFDFPAGYDFSSGKPPGPADFDNGEKRLLQFLQQNNFGELRRHGWEVFAGLTQQAPEGHANWESWFIAEQVFAGPTPAPLSDQPRSFKRSLEPPRKLGIGLGGPVALAPGQSFAFSVLFNQPARDHIWTERLFERATVVNLLSNLNQTNPPIEKRTIKDFPRDSIALKVSWRHIKRSGLTAIPVWDNDLPNPTAPVLPALPEITWKRCVAVDPTGAKPEGEVVLAQCGFEQRPSSVVHLNRFYNFQVDNQNVAVLKSVIGDEVNVGDYLVLVAFHYTTKEIPEWIWGTFWWHDKPTNGEFASDRSPKVTGVWKNYLMDVGYSRDVPAGGDGKANDIMNPYIEARFPNGVRSNCMTCHARAVFPRLPPEPNGPGQDICGALPVTRGSSDLPSSDPRLSTRVRLDFLWSVLLRPAETCN
ncbi:hypothetical protein [Bradyrhizobium liaoningense]|uniref:hypothetical protein n=1 Tax=Bradyrhizobium liaoningense TaxID=43992 RepID=UPI001BAD614E|nr:hypothetical protein [Bradyrhizobium liaoningense]MBR1070769.1 hypothetical protein [Bradyrhizobium liaoningense]